MFFAVSQKVSLEHTQPLLMDEAARSGAASGLLG